MSDLFDQLKQKYQPVLTTIQNEGAELHNLNLDGSQLYLKATAKSESSKNRIWDAIKKVDPNYADLKHDIDFSQGQSSGSQEGARRYTVKAGDNLSKISQQFYGNAGQYMKIFEANSAILKDPNKISVGQELTIPE